MIDIRFTAGDRFGVETTARIAAARALRLRQPGIDTIDVDHETEYRARGGMRQCGMASSDRTDSFTARGGWWVALQVPVLIAAAVLSPMTGYGSLWPAAWSQWVGVVVTVFGMAIAVGGLVTLGEALTPFPRPRSDAALRTHGVYALVRHPVYSGLILASLGWALWWWSGWGALYVAVVFVVLDRKSAREEIWLSAKFPEYVDYCQKVRKLIPLIY